ncbi:glycosyltransferase [Thalassorhabdus alkalitolerans]|uniref:Glycosyltransferase n=1 Tax=Thalassorhabdus alkalitolerans TaxID=2282697 RepID=A0ABW0YJ89_9BACI
MSKLVSISCITYNHEKYIREALDSLLMQETSFEYEILVHDDASTDRTQEIIRDYQKKHPDIIKPYFQKVNQYSKGIRRIGIKFNLPRAQGKYLAICEGDDFWNDPFKLQKQVDYMENNKNCTMCCHASDKVHNDGTKIGEIRPFTKNIIISPEEMILGGGGFIATNSMLYRKSLLETPPKFYENAPVGDYALQIYFSFMGECYYIDEVMSAYRKGVKGSWSSKLSGGKKGRDFSVTHWKNTIKTLESFNDFTQGQYEGIIDSRLEELRFEIKCLVGDKSALRSKYFSKLSSKQKIKKAMTLFFPSLVDRYKRLKHG